MFVKSEVFAVNLKGKSQGPDTFDVLVLLFNISRRFIAHKCVAIAFMKSSHIMTTNPFTPALTGAKCVVSQVAFPVAIIESQRLGGNTLAECLRISTNP